MVDGEARDGCGLFDIEKFAPLLSDTMLVSWFNVALDLVRTDLTCEDITWGDCMLHRSVRSLCQLRCGCQNPWIGQIYATERFGCAKSCQFAYTMIRDYGAPKPIQQYVSQCHDIPAPVLQFESSW